MNGLLYPSDLTDEQFALVEPMLPDARSGTPKGGRPREVDMHAIVNGILYFVRSGCQWRMLPREYGPWPTVHDYYRRWRRDGTLDKIHDALREQVREKAGKEKTPSAAVIDSQSVKTVEKGGLAATTRARKSGVASGTPWSIRWG